MDELLAHLIEPTHSDRFIAILEKHYPTWREARVELNELPLTAAEWDYPPNKQVKATELVLE